MGLSDGLLTQKEHYNPQWRIDGVRVKGLNGLYTERSQGYYFDVGQGVVGKVFAKQEALFVSDLQALDMESVKDAMQSGNGTEFLRASLAKEFDLRSAFFLPVPDGVLEVGSLARMTALPQYFEQYVSTSTLPVADTQPAQQSLREPTEQPPVVLQKLVEELSSAGCYGIEWTDQGGILTHRSHFNPQWRIEGLRQRGIDAAYTSQSVLFIRDVQDVSPDDVKACMQSGDGAAFLRANIARVFGIHSVLLLPSAGGVLEVGSAKTFDDFQAFLSQPAAEAVSGTTAAADVLSALEALAC